MFSSYALKGFVSINSSLETSLSVLMRSWLNMGRERVAVLKYGSALLGTAICALIPSVAT